MLPSTSKHYKRTKREYFGRRMSMMDRPLIAITFQGIMGDFIKSSFWTNNSTAGATANIAQDQVLSNLNTRVGLIKGLKFLCSNF